MKTTRLTLLWALIAVAVAGCGGSGLTATVRIPGSTPAGGGFTQYTGPGFSVAVPAGWHQVVVGPTADGRTITGWGPPNRFGASVEVEYFAHPVASATTIAGIVDTTRTTEKYVGPALRLRSLQVAPASVSGAAAAKLITKRGESSNGPHLEQDLIVQTHAGALIEVTAARYAGSPTFDPYPVIDSFRLTGTA